MARFKKGNKLGGRTKGSKNKSTVKIREVFTKVIEDNLEQLTHDLNSIEKPETRVKLLLDMAKFVVPQLKSIEGTIEENTPTHIISLGNGKPFDIRDIYNKTEESTSSE